jgi:threonyl-tRNA synthetase
LGDGNAFLAVQQTLGRVSVRRRSHTQWEGRDRHGGALSKRAGLCHGAGPVTDPINSMTQMLKISLPDGTVREMPPGSTPADVAASIGPGLAKAALAARVDGELRDLTRPFERDAALALVTARDEADALELARHDYAHVLAEAVQALWPDTQITFGPATDDGFYYDFAPGERGPFTE